MKWAWYLLVAVVVVVLLVSAIPAVLGGLGDSNEVFFGEESLIENDNTTFVTQSTDGIMLVSNFIIKDRDLNQQAKESTIIVRGRVTKMLGTVVTEDLVTPIMAEQGLHVHTDVLFQVDEYLGPNSLPFEYLVLRRMGGKIEGFTHVVEQENLTVGEEMIIFRLSRPDLMTQIPEGYSLEQYYLFNPASKFVNIDGNNYRACYNDKSYGIKQIKKASLQANKEN